MYIYIYIYTHTHTRISINLSVWHRPMCAGARVFMPAQEHASARAFTFGSNCLQSRTTQLSERAIQWSLSELGVAGTRYTSSRPCPDCVKRTPNIGVHSGLLISGLPSGNITLIQFLILLSFHYSDGKTGSKKDKHSVSLALSLSISLFVTLCLSPPLYIYLSIYVSVYLSIYLSNYQSLCQSVN